MNRIAARAVKVAVACSAVAGIVALTTAGGHAILLDVYLLCLGAVLLLAFVRTTRAVPSQHPSQFDRALQAMRRAPAESGQPNLVRDVELSTYSAFHYHARLRPLLRDVAAHRLRSRYGVELDLEPARARELVGAAAWEVVRPERDFPDDRLAPGPSLRQIAVVVDELEAV